MEHSMTQLAEFVFPAHNACWNFRADIIALHFIGDLMTALAYYIMPLALCYITRKYRFHAKLKSVLLMYAGFIVLCGTTHLMDLIMIWHVTESILIFDGVLRVLTGAFSIFSAIVTCYIAIKFLVFAKTVAGLTVQMIAEWKRYDQLKEETRAKVIELSNALTDLVHLDRDREVHRSEDAI
jgi:hypothetical protein